VPDHFFKHVVVRCQRYDRHSLVDQRDRPVLHLAGGVALGVDVGDFLQFQCALEGNRIVNATTEIQEVCSAVEASGDFFDFGRNPERFLKHMGQLKQCVDVGLGRLGRQRAADLTEPERQQVQGNQL